MIYSGGLGWHFWGHTGQALGCLIPTFFWLFTYCGTNESLKKGVCVTDFDRMFSGSLGALKLVDFMGVKVE